MGLHAAVQALKKADRLKEKVVNCEDLLNDNEAWLCQQQLQEIYQQVLILDLEYALDRKVEQELWSHGFKKYIATLQSLAKDKKNPKRNESQALLSSCLDGASGFYLTLLQEVCTAFDLDLPFRRKDVTHGMCQRAAQLTKPHKNSCYYICQHCLVHLGDIARYRNHSRQAEAFYRHAVQLSPHSGQPYNQLALLEASRGDRLSTVFHYTRSIAVRHMFPAATSNLSLTLDKCAAFQWNKDPTTTKLTTNEYLLLYLKVHAYFYMCRELDTCAMYVKTLTETLTPHIATQSFNSWKLVQMFAINAFTYYNPCRDGETQCELTEEEVRMRSYVVDLMAGFLNAYLLPVYTLKQDETLLEYFALPVVRLTLEWVRLQPHVLAEEGFTKRLQIWPSLSRLLNVLQTALAGFPADSYAKVPLPEDSDLQGFLPLEKIFNELNFGVQEGSTVSNKLRGARILHLGEWLTQHAPSLISSKQNTGSVVYEAVAGLQVAPSSELLRELEELSLNKVNSPSPAPSETASSRASNTPEPVHTHNPSIDILATLDSVQEKRAGILKPQAVTSDEGGNSNKGRSRQNVAMQAILRRSQEQETKQVTFKTPSPPPPAAPPAPAPTSVIAPPNPPADWRNNNNINLSRQLPQRPPPPTFPYPPPSIDNRSFHKIPPPPLSTATIRPPLSNLRWPEEPRTPTWWQPPEESPFSSVQPPRPPNSFGLSQPQVQQPSSNDIFSNSVSYKNPFSTMFSQPPPFSSSIHPSENTKNQVLEPPQNSNLMSPTYSLFSPRWTAHQHPPPPVSNIMGQQAVSFGGTMAAANKSFDDVSNYCVSAWDSDAEFLPFSDDLPIHPSCPFPMSLWFGPGPSPLERLLEQQKQLREGPNSHSDAT